MKALVKNILLLILVILFLLPLAQQKFHFVAETKLSGAIVNAPYSPFSIENWWSGRYQEEITNYLNDKLGFRSYFIKSNNQFDFDFIEKVHANGIVIGKHNYLFEKYYIDAYCGLQYESDSAMSKKLFQLKKIQDTLDALGKKLLLIHAPSKAWFYPKEFPYLLECKQGKTIYKDCLRIEDSLKINYIDFNSYFLKIKDTSKHLLFSKQGTHWTLYGALLAADSMTKYLSRNINKKLPELIIDSLKLTDTALFSDNDIAQGLNLWQPVAQEKFAYVHYHFKEQAGTEKLNAIYIGDSFFWTFWSTYVPHRYNDNFEFWYYFTSNWYRKNGKEGDIMMENYDWFSAINKSDMIVLMYTDINLNNLGDGFIEKAFKHYYPDKKNVFPPYGYSFLIPRLGDSK